jgi:UDP-N-acetylglucosamine transferase subunit ALG13
VIFVTVGTHQQPFARLLDGLAGLPAGELVVQHGYAPAPAGVARAAPFMPYLEMVRCFEEAERVVTHAGVGSILSARRAGHVPVVVPRQKRHGEHVDDHQLELTRALAATGHVIAVLDMATLAAALASAPPRGAPAGSSGALHAAVREALGAASAPQRPLEVLGERERP